MANAFDVLAKDHEEVKRMLAELERADPAHPKTPASPGLLKTAGPAVAAADRLRDAATGRDEYPNVPQALAQPPMTRALRARP
jgi:hypothetical protein